MLDKNYVSRFNGLLSKIFHKKYMPIFLVVFFSLFSCLYLLKDGILLGHDLEFHLSRIISIKESLQHFDFPALIHNGLNHYGYATGLFYSNLFLYFPAFLHLLGVSVIISYKLFLVVVSIGTGLLCFTCVKAISKSNFAATLSSILYVLCSYRICDVYVRAAVGEILAFLLLPVIIWGLYELLWGNHKKFYIFSIGFVGLITSHLISTVLMFLICLAILVMSCFTLLEQPKRILYLCYSALFGIFLGAFFIFPMLEQYAFSDLLINTVKTEVTTHPFLSSFSGLTNYTTRFIPPGVGFVFLFAIFCRLQIKGEKENLKIADLFLGCGLLILLFSTEIIPWKELTPILGSIQFSWRLYLFSSLFLAISSGIIFYYYQKQVKYNYVFVGILVFYVTSLCFVNQFLGEYSIKNFYLTEQPSLYLTDYNGSSIAAGEYMPTKTDWSLLDIDERKPKTNSKSIKIDYEEKNGKIYVRFENNLEEGTYIDIPKIYYKGYSARSLQNTEYYAVDAGYNTWVRIHLPNVLEGELVIWYKGTRVKRLSVGISLLTIFVSSGYLVLRKKKIKSLKK